MYEGNLTTRNTSDSLIRTGKTCGILMSILGLLFMFFYAFLRSHSSENELIFATCYRTSGIEKVGDGIYSTTNVLYKFFKVNLQSGKLSGHGYSIYDSMKENSAQIQAFSGIDFSETLNTEKKNKLAEAYAETLNNN